MKYLIVNADEFGLSEGVNKGIIEAYKNGIVKSTTLVVCGKGYSQAVEYLKNNNGLDAGVHLTLTDGMPIASNDKVITLVNKENKFYKRDEFIKKMMLGKISTEEIKTEFVAQIDKTNASGISLSHLDSHQSTYIHPKIFPIVIEIAKKYGLPIRFPIDPVFLNKKPSFKFKTNIHIAKKILLKVFSIKQKNQMRVLGVKTSDHFRTYFDFHADKRDYEEAFIRLLSSLNEGVTEVMTHPGYWDADLCEWVYGEEDKLLRENELKVLVSDKIKNYIKDNSIEVINYKKVKI